MYKLLVACFASLVLLPSAAGAAFDVAVVAFIIFSGEWTTFYYFNNIILLVRNKSSRFVMSQPTKIRAELSAETRKKMNCERNDDDDDDDERTALQKANDNGSSSVQ